MAKWQPALPEAVTAFEQMTEGLPGIEPRKKFGYVCVFAHGYLCIGTHEVGIVMRLPEAARGEFLTKYEATIFEPMPWQC